MLRHWVNFGLLFSFLTLMASGVLAYLQPFSLVTTRVHVVFGLLTALLVALHLISRMPYFASKLVIEKSRRMIAAIAITWVALLAIAWWGTWPAKPLMAASYESRHKLEIVRQSPLAGMVSPDNNTRLVARQPGADADTAISLLVRFSDSKQAPPAIAVWAETSTGSMIETLYLDPKLAFSEQVEWHGIQTQRHQLLPIWRHKYTLVSGVDPLGEVDAFTAATPSHAFTLDQYLKSGKEGNFVICVEVNAVGDANATFPDPSIGQPSLLYTAYVEPNGESAYRLLELTAHGGGAANSGTLKYDFDGIDSAKQLVDLLLLHVQRIDP